MGELRNTVLNFKGNNNVFLIDEVGENTYADVYSYIEKHSYLESFREKGQHVGICLGNTSLYVKWFCLCVAMEMVVVPINPLSSEYELYNYITSCDLDVFVVSQNSLLIPKEEKIQHRLRLIIAETGEEIILGKELPKPEKAEEGFLEIIATSGSSGCPKRVMLSEDNLVTNAKDIINSLNYTEKERFFVVLPLCFSSANTSQLIVCMMLGASLFLYNGNLHPKQIWKSCMENSITAITVVPSLLQILIQSKWVLQSKEMNGWNLKTLCYGGGCTPEGIKEKAIQVLEGVNVVHLYGQTEASPRISHLHVKDFSRKKGSVGKCLEHITVKVVQEDGTVCLPGEKGEIIVSGRNVMKGYYRDKKLTETTLRDGWLHTGDIGYLDEEGYIYITGRLKNVIITSGINIYPEEIENILMDSGRLKQVLVLGVESELYGEEIAVKAVRKEGEFLTEEELFDYCEKHLPCFKLPHFIEFVDALKTTANGKIRRKKGE